MSDNISINQPGGNVHHTPTTVISTNTTVKTENVSINSNPQTTIKQGEIKMADVDTTQLSQEHGAIRYDIATEAGALSKQIGAEACGINKSIGDARREGAAETADIRYDLATRAGDIRREVADAHCKTDSDVLKTGSEIRSDIKDARYDLYAQIDRGFDRTSADVENAKDTIIDRQWSLNRDLIDTKTQVQTGFIGVTKDVEIGALKTQLEAQKNTQFLSDKIEADGDRTRALINDLKYHDLNRGLVERNAELVECEADRRHWRHTAEQNQFQGQWAALQSQIQAFASQLQDTKQGITNFGSMRGVGQSSTSNNA